MVRVVFCQEDDDDWTDETYDDRLEERAAHWLRVVGGADALITDHPYIAQVWAQNGFVGGGSIIAKRWIITAAHVASERSGPVVAVLVGSNVLGQGIRHEVDMIKHEGYSRLGFKNDIALLRLRTPVQFSRQVGRITMGTIDTRNGRSPTAEVIGFGATRSSLLAAILQKANLLILDDAACTRAAYGARNPTFSSNQMLCAAEFREKKDACSGDSGGPLVVKTDPSHHVLVGLVSYGPKSCGASRIPGFYTRISYYIGWVLNKLRTYSRRRTRSIFNSTDASITL